MRAQPLRETSFEDLGFVSAKAIENQVVREPDPRSGRELWGLLGLVAALVAGLVLYAWPNLELRTAARLKEQMSRERERLLEANRKLTLEKSSLEDLRRVEAIAVRDLGMVVPPPDEVIVVEKPPAPPAGTQLAGPAADPGAKN